MKFLKAIHNNCVQNLMDAKNLSIIWSPTLARKLHASEAQNSASWNLLVELPIASTCIENIILKSSILFD